MGKSKKMTQEAANRIKSATSKANGGIIPKNLFASRAERAAVKNES